MERKPRQIRIILTFTLSDICLSDINQEIKFKKKT